MTKYYKVVIVKQEGSSVVPEIFMRSGKANPTVPFTVPTTKNNGRSAISTSPPHPPMIEISIGLLHPSFPLILANKINHRYKILFSLSFFLFFFIIRFQSLLVPAAVLLLTLALHVVQSTSYHDLGAYNCNYNNICFVMIRSRIYLTLNFVVKRILYGFHIFEK